MVGAGSARSVDEWTLGGGDRLEDADPLVNDAVGELGARGHPDLTEDLAQVVFHGARAEEQLGGDLPVRFSAAHQGGDLRFLGGELLRGPKFPFPGALARGPKLDARPFGEGVQTHGVEHVVRGAQLVARLSPPALAA